jgi:hypothetical protein
MERGRNARTTHVARVTSLPHEPSHQLPRTEGDAMIDEVLIINVLRS